MQVLPFVSMALGAAGSVMSASGQAEGAHTQAENAEYQAQTSRINAYATDAYYRNDLRTTLANISAARASVGMGDSPTSQVIADNNTEISNLQRSSKVTSLFAQSTMSEKARDYYQSAAQNYLMSGFLSAGAGIVKGIGQSPWYQNVAQSW